MKDLQISKELIKAVLERETENLSEDFSFYINEAYIIFSDEGEQLFDYNIHKFTFKCKEWAFSKGYIISSGLTPVLGVNKDGWAEVFSSSTPLDGKLHTFKQLSEPEAVFKACEWILEYKD